MSRDSLTLGCWSTSITFTKIIYKLECVLFLTEKYSHQEHWIPYAPWSEKPCVISRKPNSSEECSVIWESKPGKQTRRHYRMKIWFNFDIWSLVWAFIYFLIPISSCSERWKSLFVVGRILRWSPNLSPAPWHRGLDNPLPLGMGRSSEYVGIVTTVIRS